MRRGPDASSILRAQERMKSRYAFNATEGSVLATPYQYVLVARPGSLRIVNPSARSLLVTLAMLLACAFGVIAAFSFVAMSPWFPASVSWESPPLLGAFVVAFSGMLYAAERWSRTLAVAISSQQPGRAWDVTLRDLKPGPLVQQLVLQTSDNRFLSVEVEATTAHLSDALRIAGAVLPSVS